MHTALEHDPRSAGVSRNACLVQMFEQRDRVLACQPGECLEPPHIESLSAMPPHIRVERSQCIRMNERIVGPHPHQLLRAQQKDDECAQRPA